MLESFAAYVAVPVQPAGERDEMQGCVVRKGWCGAVLAGGLVVWVQVWPDYRRVGPEGGSGRGVWRHWGCVVGNARHRPFEWQEIVNLKTSVPRTNLCGDLLVQGRRLLPGRRERVAGAWGEGGKCPWRGCGSPFTATTTTTTTQHSTLRPVVTSRAPAMEAGSVDMFTYIQLIPSPSAPTTLCPSPPAPPAPPPYTTLLTVVVSGPPV
ncbi:hypothetical protein O3P69_007321 [Scylla paramamosain]|uniref:Uncharacterized protein n=1 Tax=Scylla paramamosain TaxID=85552 RepID=A0AAW0V2U3_SCYPA